MCRDIAYHLGAVSHVESKGSITRMLISAEMGDSSPGFSLGFFFSPLFIFFFFFKEVSCPAWVTQLFAALFHTAKSCRFDSRLGHIPGYRIRSLVRAYMGGNQ